MSGTSEKVASLPDLRPARAGEGEGLRAALARPQSRPRNPEAKGCSSASKRPPPNSISPVLELERAHVFFNRTLFDGRLTGRVVVTIQTAGKRRVHGWYQAGAWKNGKERVAELNLSAEDLHRPVEDLLETVIHEMVHQADVEAGIEDTCDQGRYHNAAFKRSAEKAGLVCAQSAGHGWAETELGPRAREAILRFKPKKEAFRVARLLTGGRRKTPTKLVKWVCDCGFGVRVAKAEFNAECLDCGEQFRKED